MKKKLTIFIVGFFFFTLNILSQDINVQGKVTENSGELPGVSVLIKGTKKGTSTDFDGMYSIEAKKGDILVFSSLGYKTKEVIVSSTTHNVTLEEDASLLDEIVITSFGIKKEERSLGYAVQQVKVADLELNGQTSAISALQGRVAGVQINQSSGAAGGGLDILIRGVTSVNPDRNNQPLIIVDGLAINNDTYSGNVLPSTNTSSPGSAEQFSFSNRGADINPDDIESFSILKGAAATALYGVRASNGAIIITTKKGKEGKARIDISASTTVRSITKTPELQSTYREGYSGLPRGLYTPDSETGFTRLGGTVFYDWGPKYTDDSAIVGGEVVDLSNDKYYSPYDLFRSGINNQMNFSISGANDKIDYFFSMGNNSEEGVLPNTDYERNNFRIKGSYKVSEDFEISSSVAYTKSGGKRGNGGDKSVFSALSYFSGSFPINDYQNIDGSERDYSFGVIDNPRYVLENSPLIDDVNRWIGNVTFNWKPKDWINVMYAAQIDNYSDNRNRFVGPDLDRGSQTGGYIVNQNINFVGLESNLLVTLNKDWTDNFSTTLTVGNQISDTKRDASTVRGERLNVPGINDLANTINTFATNEVTQLRNIGVFGEFQAAYKNKLFLTITGRNDWVSTLPKENRSFFYPSVSLAYDIKDLIDKEGSVLSFGKLRASWAEVGKGPLFGQVGHYFVSDGDFPFGGAGGYRASTQLGFTEMIPESNKSYELGADFRFFKNRFRLDYSYYSTRIDNQIFTVGTAYSSGLSGIVRNAGDFEVKGHEFSFSADIFKNENFKWNAMLNWSTNEGRVLSLPEDIESLTFADSGFAGVTSEIRDGDLMGTLYGYKWRYENGERYIASDGLPRVDLDKRVNVGNAFPDFVTSLSNNISYKKLSLNFLLEWKKGGDLYDSGRRNSLRNGILKVTEYRNVEAVLDGVMDDGNGGYTTNTILGTIDQDYYRSSTSYNRAAEVLVQDASWVKLRTIGVTYSFDGEILKKLKMRNLSITANANNLLLWTPYEGYDPEGSQYSAGANVYGFTGLSTPISESYSLGIKLGF